LLQERKCRFAKCSTCRTLKTRMYEDDIEIEEEKKYDNPFGALDADFQLAPIRGVKFNHYQQMQYRACDCCGRMQYTECNYCGSSIRKWYCGMCKEDIERERQLYHNIIQENMNEEADAAAHVVESDDEPPDLVESDDDMPGLYYDDGIISYTLYAGAEPESEDYF
jgi:hypothetical protein